MPTSRHVPCCSTVGKEVIVAGGQESTGSTNVVEIYSIDYNSWRSGEFIFPQLHYVHRIRICKCASTAHPLPARIQGGRPASIGSTFALVGGIYHVGSNYSSYDSIYKYDPIAERFILLPTKLARGAQNTAPMAITQRDLGVSC